MKLLRPLLLLTAPLLLLTPSCSADVATAPVRDPRAEARLATLLGGKVQGATRSCIARRDAERQEIIDENTIIYRVSSNRIIRGNIAPACTGLDRGSTLIRRSISTDICAGEIFEVRDAGTQFPQGSCSYGDFTEYRTPRR